MFAREADNLVFIQCWYKFNKNEKIFKIFLKIWNFWLEIVRRHVTLKMRAWRKILSSKTKMRMFRSFYTQEYAAVWTVLICGW